MSDRVALITGAAGGIGRATADAFVADGWTVVGCDLVAGTGPWATFAAEDVADPTTPERLRQLVVERHGRLDALVNNAALQVDRALVDTDDESWRRVMNVNLDGAFRLLRTFHPLLATSRGAVVNVASVHALATSANVAAYAVSKAAIVGLTRTAAIEMAAEGIRCNAVLPGAVRTPMLTAGLGRRPHPDGPDGNLAALIARTPLGFVAEPRDIAPAIVFLADAARAGYITGQTLTVDGGATARLGTE